MEKRRPTLEELRTASLGLVALALLAFLLPHLRRPGLAKQLAADDDRDPRERLTEAIAKAQKKSVAPARARATKRVWQIALGIWASAERDHPNDLLAIYEQAAPAIAALIARLHATDFGRGKRKTRKPGAWLRFDANDWYPLYYAALVARQRRIGHRPSPMPWPEFLDLVTSSGGVVPYVSAPVAAKLRTVKDWAHLFSLALSNQYPNDHLVAAAVVSYAAGHSVTYIKRALYRLGIKRPRRRTHPR